MNIKSHDIEYTLKGLMWDKIDDQLSPQLFNYIWSCIRNEGWYQKPDIHIIKFGLLPDDIRNKKEI